MSERRSLEEREAEIAWMTGRMGWPPPENVGISSNALVKALVLDTDVAAHEYPHDPPDLLRCMIAVVSAPSHLKTRAYAIYEQFVVAVERRYPLAGQRVAERLRPADAGDPL